MRDRILFVQIEGSGFLFRQGQFRQHFFWMSLDTEIDKSGPHIFKSPGTGIIEIALCFLPGQKFKATRYSIGILLTYDAIHSFK